MRLHPGPAKAALTLRQNIYTDPQKPIQMTPGIYQVGTPGPDSPVLLTVNFSLTYFTLQGYLEAAKVNCYMLIVDTEGLSVLTAVAAGKLNETLVKESLKKFGVEQHGHTPASDHPRICGTTFGTDRRGDRLESARWSAGRGRDRRVSREGREALNADGDIPPELTGRCRPMQGVHSSMPRSVPAFR